MQEACKRWCTNVLVGMIGFACAFGGINAVQAQEMSPLSIVARDPEHALVKEALTIVGV